MVLCEVRQCNNLLYGGHWFLKYGDKKKGFSLEEENYNNKGIIFYFNLIKLIIKTIISIFFPKYYDIKIINNDYRGNNYTVITKFECNEKEIDEIFKEKNIKNKKFSYNKYNCRHILYNKINHLLNEQQKQYYSKYLDYNSLPIFLMK